MEAGEVVVQRPIGDGTGHTQVHLEYAAERIRSDCKVQTRVLYLSLHHLLHPTHERDDSSEDELDWCLLGAE